jgi:hypothetical protein
MTDGVHHFWEELEFIRCFLTPGFCLIGPVGAIMGGIQLNRVKLAGILFQLVFSAAGKKSFQIFFIPFCTTHIGVKVIAAFLV